jgi:DNA polymerase-3 subunit epsilon
VGVSPTVTAPAPDEYLRPAAPDGQPATATTPATSVEPAAPAEPVEPTEPVEPVELPPALTGVAPGLAGLSLAETEFAVVDLETTGWSPGTDAITEIGAVRVRGGVRRGEFGSLVNPGTPVPPSISELTGITDWLLAAAPRAAAVLPGLLRFADGCVLVAHNAPFDVGFLAAACDDCGLAWPGFAVLDTVILAKHVLDPDEVPDCKLSTLAQYFGARTAPTHRALSDARATADVLGSLIARLAGHGVHTLGQLSDWPAAVVA